jgi:hypothetical protein
MQNHEELVPRNNSISLDSVITRNAAVVEAEIHGEVVAMNIETGNCYGLNLVGSRVWNLLSDPVRISGICAQLNVEFDVEPDICEREVIGLLEELQAEDLIAVV